MTPKLRATTLSPKMAVHARIGASSATAILMKELPAIKTTGIRMVRKAEKVPGRSLSLMRISSTLSDLVSLISATTSGTGSINSLSVHFRSTSQVSMKARMEMPTPHAMTNPRSAPSIIVTNKMPGVGGTMAWVRFNPVWVKAAILPIEMCFRLESTLAILEVRIVVISPNTGIDTM